ncbi:hypothetical protein M407DRAFT_138907 [Tulasnella calospora MUT 4182]|uniref:Uncharacterized protein n=1 Tax=Tulasnella calospora MUT 4182 TaxID=1051891 RepID=A0A0C3MBP0_9AGAM|nr:hypothetical protein M407DRAFT_138907 [Tulasnella calospora MUT 4182]
MNALRCLVGVKASRFQVSTFEQTSVTWPRPLQIPPALLYKANEDWYSHFVGERWHSRPLDGGLLHLTMPSSRAVVYNCSIVMTTLCTLISHY